jgi:hypothetical protein
MAREIPEVVRAAAGLAATVLDEARKLPETLPGLPVRAIGLAMQGAMKIQQHYAGLVARGDEVFTGIRGENEPGLATFDDDEPVAAAGFRNSAFDRAHAPSAEDVAAPEEFADGVEGGQGTIDELADEAQSTDEVLEELAIDEMVGDAPVSVDVLTSTTSEEDSAIAEGATVDAVGARAEAPTDDPEGGSELSGSQAAGTAPIEGYDSFSIAQLRGRLRGYALSTVVDLIAYEEATRARDPYLRMLRNRLEKLEEQAVESSPLAPRGA